MAPSTGPAAPSTLERDTSVRDGIVTMATTALVAAAAATFAHLFRESILAVARLLTGEDRQVGAAASLDRWQVGVLVALGICTAAWLGRVARRRHGDRVGLTAVADAARGSGPGPATGATALRAAATWTATASLTSLGREAPIMETGGTLGTLAGRVTGRSGSRLATAGIAAAFAAAYHAPVAAVLYVEEHLGVRHDRRTVAHAVAGSLIGFLVMQRVWGGHPIFPGGVDPLSPSTLLLAVLAVVPAYTASRLFLAGRDRFTARPASAATPWLRTLVLAAIAGTLVALVPLTAGNGMEAIRQGAGEATVGLALALLVAKLVATTAAVASGAPGGVVSPSLAVAGGAAMAVYLLLGAAGLHLGSSWDAVLVVMAVGVAISVRSPLVAIVMGAEMTGDVRVLPLSALVVGLAVLLDRFVEQRRAQPEPTLHDEDA